MKTLTKMKNRTALVVRHNSDFLVRELFFTFEKKNMPTILVIAGWRLFFYSNERNEPIHIHAVKADMECKY